MDNENVKKGTYITIQSWMVNVLGLRGNELLCYAIIFGFSQDGESEFNGSRKYISNWLGCSLPTVDTILTKLLTKGVVVKKTNKVNGVIFNTYKCVDIEKFNKNDENFIGYKKILHPVKNFDTDNNSINNIFNYNNTVDCIDDNNNNNNDDEDNNNNINIKKENTKRKNESSTKTDLYNQFVAFVKLYKKLTKKNVRGVETEFNDFKSRHRDWKEVIPYLSLAIIRESKAREDSKSNGRFFPEPKMLQTYLGKQRAWELYVTIGEDISETNNEYQPITGGNFVWNEQQKKYVFLGMNEKMLIDGYNDETRPDGAVVLFSSRGDYVWSKQQKKWIKK